MVQARDSQAPAALPGQADTGPTARSRHRHRSGRFRFAHLRNFLPDGQTEENFHAQLRLTLPGHESASTPAHNRAAQASVGIADSQLSYFYIFLAFIYLGTEQSSLSCIVTHHAIPKREISSCKANQCKIRSRKREDADAIACREPAGNVISCRAPARGAHIRQARIPHTKYRDWTAQSAAPFAHECRTDRPALHTRRWHVRIQCRYLHHA